MLHIVDAEVLPAVDVGEVDPLLQEAADVPVAAVAEVEVHLLVPPAGDLQQCPAKRLNA
jgi:hypothetical protein